MEEFKIYKSNECDFYNNGFCTQNKVRLNLGKNKDYRIRTPEEACVLCRYHSEFVSDVSKALHKGVINKFM
ncbi:MAG: hypothetical protein V1870_04945 [Candidatus Aenigmatarchaeota archaeon]